MESKAEKVLEKYFTETPKEKVLSEQKRVNKFLTEKIQKVNQKKKVKELSETFEQELTADFILSENANAIFVGKTNHKNLIFEINQKQFKVTKLGEIL